MLRLVGNVLELGAWDVEKGLPLTWSDGNVWSVTAYVPVDVQLEFKVGGLRLVACHMALRRRMRSLR